MKYSALAFVLLFPFLSMAQGKYSYAADLQNIDKDRVLITLKPPVLNNETEVFSFPRIIPGSYNEKNFGAYIENFEAKDADGRKLKAKKLNANQYSIANAAKIASISYEVNDTWDKATKDFVFPPGGTNIEAGNNVVMNNHAFFGYFEGYSKLPIELTVLKPESMYASTHLPVTHTSAMQDVFKASGYFELADNPVIYSVPDTTSFMSGNTNISVSVVSRNGKVKSKQVAEYLKPLASGLNQFFNGLPVNSYQFLFFFEDPDNMQKNSGFGALEHNYCSLYFLPEMSFESKLKSLVLEVAGHEFLHILTPLNLHSEEIENFDFTEPRMSKHLWLYEGVTEYFAHLMQVQNGLITEEVFIKNMRKKINESQDFGEFSLATMSEHVLEKDYKDKYNSVYSKGAVTALLLDIFIRDKTAGKKDLKTVIQTLAKKYGAKRPFKDSEFFDDVVAASHPDVRQFINDYIAGDKPLPYEEEFAMIGYDYSKLKKIPVYYNGSMAIKFEDTNNAFLFTDVEKQNALQVKDGDEFISVNNIMADKDNLEQLWETYFNKNTEYPSLTLIVKRNGTTKVLSGRLYNATMEAKSLLEPVANAANAQIALKTALLSGSSTVNAGTH